MYRLCRPRRRVRIELILVAAMLSAALFRAGWAVGQPAAAGAAGGAPAAGQADLPTPEQLVALVEASRAGYRSFNVEFEVERYLYKNGKRQPHPLEVAKLVWRSTPDKVLFHEDQRARQPDGSEQRLQKTYASDAKHTKRLGQAEHDDPRAIIAPGTQMMQEIDLNPATALWSPTSPTVYTRIKNDNSTVSKDASSGNLLLKGVIGSDGSRVVISIDPTKGYLPVRTDTYRKDGTFIMGCVCSDVREVVQGKWLAYTFTWRLDSHAESVFRVTKAEVNTDIPPEQLDFSFPSGTIVDDRIAGLRYHVGDERDLRLTLQGEHFLPNGPATRPDGDLVTPASLKVVVPPKDTDLDAVADRALAIAASHRAQRRGWIAGAVVACVFVVLAGAYRIRQKRSAPSDGRAQ